MEVEQREENKSSRHSETTHARRPSLLAIPANEEKFGFVNGPDVRQIWRLVRAYRYFVGFCVLSAISLTLTYSFFSAPIYKTRVAVSVTTTLPHAVADMVRPDDSMSNKLSLLQELFKAPELSEQVLRNVEARHDNSLIMLTDKGLKSFLNAVGLIHTQALRDAVSARPHGELLDAVMSRLSMTVDYANNSVIIEANAPHPELAQFLANAAAAALLGENHRMVLKKITETKQFLARQSSDMGAKLQSLETELTGFQSDTKIISETDAAKSVYDSMDKQEQALTEARMHLETNKSLLKQVGDEMARIRDNIKNSPEEGSNLYLAQLQHRLSMLQYQQEMLQTNPGAAGGGIDRDSVHKEIESVATAYKSALEARENSQAISYMSPLEYYQSLEQSMATLKRDNKRFQSDVNVLDSDVQKHINKVPKLALTLQRLNALKRNIALTTELYLALKKRLQETEIQEAGTINDVSVLAPAPRPARPYALSAPLKIAFAASVGLFFAVMLILMREAFIPTIRSREDFEKEGIIPIGELPLAEPEGHADGKGLLVVEDMPGTYEADSLRALRLKFISYVDFYCDDARASGNKDAVVLMVTSAKAGDGKTFTAVNLATALAKSERKTLVVDLDLRRSSIQKYFGGVRAGGSIADLMSGEHGEIKSTVNPFLDVVFGGKPMKNPLDLLDSQRIAAFLEKERANYEFIIIDMPPVLGVIDPVILAPVTDLMVLVAEHRKTLKDDVVLARQALRETSMKPLLGVINGVQREFTYYENYRNYEQQTV